MKKGLKILVIIVMTFISVDYVKADSYEYTVENHKTFFENKKNDLEIAEEIIQNNNYKYYAILYRSNTDIELIMWNENINTRITYNGENNLQNFRGVQADLTGNSKGYTINNGSQELVANAISLISNESSFGLMLYKSNYEFTYLNDKFDLKINGIYNDSVIIKNNDKIPELEELYKYSSWSDYENNHLKGYTEVDLDNYEYVLLSLKDYNQTKAFSTNLQVKGQIGITPIYNYGQTSKDSITGVQVQDRCNVSYKNYTSYPFYILKSDLQNNAIYAVKECSNGSSFKFDNNIFDITYITEENKDNPTVTINGKTYGVIPYSDLPSTATKNEEDNYIPGESGSAKDTGGLDSAIKGTQQKMSEIWNTFTYFTDFINQIFSVFPDEVKTILLSAFTIIIVIGLIKIFIN